MGKVLVQGKIAEDKEGGQVCFFFLFFQFCLSHSFFVDVTEMKVRDR